MGDEMNRVRAARTLVFGDAMILKGESGELIAFESDSFAAPTYLVAKVTFDWALARKPGPPEWVEHVDVMVSPADLAADIPPLLIVRPEPDRHERLQ